MFTKDEIVERDYDSVQEEFKAALVQYGLHIDGMPIMDGKIHRVQVTGDKGQEKSGAYCAYLDGRPAGFIQNFKSGEKHNWKTIQHWDSQREYDIAIAHAIAQKYIHQQQRRALHIKTAQILKAEFNAAKYAHIGHAYLQNKGLDSNYFLKQDRYGNLLIPLYDITGFMWSVQRIFANGQKMIGVLRTKDEKEQGIEYPAKKTGCFSVIGGKLEWLKHIPQLIISEGFATAASLSNALKQPVIMAVDAGNLESVTQALVDAYPNKPIIIAADNDMKKERDNQKNIGLETANAIAQKFSHVSVIKPIFTDNEMQQGMSDFNDIAKARGVDSIRGYFVTILKHIKTQPIDQHKNSALDS